jgi:hypothetical protein
MTRWLAAALLAVPFLLLGCSSSPSPPTPPTPPTPPAPDAEVVLGQADFTSAAPNRGGATAAEGVWFPVGDAAAYAGGLALPDTYNHRVLLYETVPAANGAAPSAILGQPDAASATPSHAPGRLHYPRSVGVSGTDLLVADGGASRVVLGAGGSNVALGWDAAAPAHRWGCAADRLSEPARAVVAGGRLLVADRANHRVLIWNAVPAGTAPPDVVLGQKDLVHCAANDMVGQGHSGGRSAATLHSPSDVWSDGTRLLVVDQGNHRVLLWNRFPTANAQPAELVLGQPDFLVGRTEVSASGMNWPAAVASDGVRIWVADTRNNRVLRWSAFPTANGAPADGVLGQRDLAHGAANDDDGNGVAGPPTSRTMNQPMGLALAGDRLVVSDTYNHRFLLFAVR